METWSHLNILRLVTLRSERLARVVTRRRPLLDGHHNYLRPLSISPDGSVLEYVPAGKTTGETNHVKTYKASPGDLQFFMGRYCLHQITKVHGDRTRLVAIFAFSDEKEFWNPVSRSVLNCGRAYPGHYEREAKMVRDHL